MQITRRRLLATATASLVPTRLWSATQIDLSGGRQVLSLSDGHLELPAEFVFGAMPDAERDAILARHGLPTRGPLIAPCNVTLLRDGTNTVLFDVGAGPDFQSTAGRLAEALAAAGTAPEDVTHVIFTHGHPDHLWGLLDEFDEPVFPEAQYLIGGDEFAFWTDPATVDTIDPARTTFAVGARRRLEALEDRIETFDADAEVIPGITARLTPGHTPGHMSFDLGELLVTGDCIGNGHVSFDRPEALLGSDQDPEPAAETRVKLMRALAASGQAILGFHLPGGGIGRVIATERTYRFEAL